MTKIFDKIIKTSIYLLVFLVPLFWLPFSFEVFEFNKQELILFLVSLAFLAWLARMILVEKELRFRRTPLDIPVLVFLFLAILSAVFSVDKNSSVFGFYGRFSDGLIGLLSLGMLYFLITNNVIKEVKGELKEVRGELREVKGELRDDKGKLRDDKGKLRDDKGKLRDDKGAMGDIKGVLRVFLWSVFFVVLMSYFSVFGVWTKIQSLLGTKFQLPQVMLQATFNPVSGSMEGLAVFLSVVVVLLVGMILLRGVKGELKEVRGELKEVKGELRGAKPAEARRAKAGKGKLGGVKGLPLYLLLIASLGLLLIIDFTSAWIVLLVTLTLFVGLGLWKRMFRENVNKALLPIFLIIIAVIFIASSPFKNTQVGPMQFALPQEQVLSQGVSWQVGAGAATENVKAGFLGSGIGTFHYDFAKFKPLDFNQNRLWQIRFDRSGSHIAELLATVGFLGLLSYLVLVGLFLLVSWILLGEVRGELKEVKGELKDDKGKLREVTLALQLPLLMVLVALVVSQFVYYQNTILAFAFWLILGLSVVSWQKPLKEKIFSFKDFPELSLIFSVLLIILGLAILVIYFFAGKFYLADNNYAQVTRESVSTKRINLLEKAISLNPCQPQYKTVLARAYLNTALSELAKSAAEQNQEALSLYIYRAITYVKGGMIDEAYVMGAAELAPERVAAWETLGMIYRDIGQVASGALQWGIKAFEKAITLEPVNPVLQTELGKLYAAADDFPKAKETFEKAKTLKPDYIDALIQIALIAEREDNLGEAIKNLEELSQNYPFNIEISFQLGRLYFNNNQVDEAISQFKKVTTLMPNHSNALYSLGVAYQKKGNIKEAISAFEKVLEFNPGNQDVIQKLEELKK